MTDVKLLIAALTTERDSLTRAITALEQISHPAPVMPRKVRTTRTARPARRTRIRAISPEARAQIVSQMRQASMSGQALRPMAKALAQEFGIKPMTIYFSWKRWELNTANGRPPAFTPTADIVETH